MPFPLKFRVTGSTRGIEQAKQILSRSVRGGLTGVGKLLTQAIQPRTRYFEGHERRDVRYVVRGRGLALVLDVYGMLVQTVIDELGLPPGTFPPHRAGSKIYRWVEKRGMRGRSGPDNREPGKKAVRYGDVSMNAASQKEVVRVNRGGAEPAKRVPLISPAQSRAIKGARLRAKASREGQWFNFKSKGTGAFKVRRRSWRIERIAYLVARKIYDEGIKPTQPFSRGLDANRGRVMRELQNAIARAVNRINRGV